MRKVRGVKQYAKKFVGNVAVEEISKALDSLSVIVSLMEKDKGFRNLMVSPMFTKEDRAKSLSVLSQKLQCSEKLTKYLGYLADEKALGALPEISTAILALYLEMKQRSQAVVTTPVAVSKEFEAELLAALRRRTGREIDVEYVVDPSLLGGVRIKVGSTMYDTSLKGQLGLLKDKLIEG
ncbi:MAG: F-type H+-transporting ATPase subunit delta [Nitrospirae bacterium]|nr:MAG: F-type H+-transporting ATPase subunit delta [Nitrospirota bacterium]